MVHLKSAFDKTLREETKLSPNVLLLPGMSGKLNRIFLNNLCEGKDVKYLEIGSWQGSTIISASFKNPGKFYAIDNFSQFEGTLDKLIANKSKFKECNFEFFNSDCWEFDRSNIKDKINIYFFDGPHDYESHYKALAQYHDVLDDEFIFVVDDWNDGLGTARPATYKSIEDLNYKIHEKIEIGHYKDSDSNGWWNGLGIFRISK